MTLNNQCLYILVKVMVAVWSVRVGGSPQNVNFSELIYTQAWLRAPKCLPWQTLQRCSDVTHSLNILRSVLLCSTISFLASLWITKSIVSQAVQPTLKLIVIFPISLSLLVNCRSNHASAYQPCSCLSYIWAKKFSFSTNSLDCVPTHLPSSSCQEGESLPWGPRFVNQSFLSNLVTIVV